jgi:Neuraminidase (sialidase)
MYIFSLGRENGEGHQHHLSLLNNGKVSQMPVLYKTFKMKRQKRKIKLSINVAFVELLTKEEQTG